MSRCLGNSTINVAILKRRPSFRMTGRKKFFGQLNGFGSLSQSGTWDMLGGSVSTPSLQSDFEGKCLAAGAVLFALKPIGDPDYQTAGLGVPIKRVGGAERGDSCARAGELAISTPLRSKAHSIEPAVRSTAEPLLAFYWQRCSCFLATTGIGD
jgi:hypothetical protein